MNREFPRTVTLRKTHADGETGESTYDIVKLAGVPLADFAEETRAELRGTVDDQRAYRHREDVEGKLQIVRQLRETGAVEVELGDHCSIRVRWPEPTVSATPAATGRSAKGSDAKSSDTSGG